MICIVHCICSSTENPLGIIVFCMLDLLKAENFALLSVEVSNNGVPISDMIPEYKKELAV